MRRGCVLAVVLLLIATPIGSSAALAASPATAGSASTPTLPLDSNLLPTPEQSTSTQYNISSTRISKISADTTGNCDGVNGYKFCVDEVSLSDDVIEPGDEISIEVTIENRGDRLGTALVSRGVEKPDGERSYNSKKYYDIAVGETKTKTFYYTVPTSASAGKYDVTIDVHTPPDNFLFDTTEFGDSFRVNNPPSSSREDPVDADITIKKGTEQQFEVDAEDPDGDLDGVDWYIDGDIEDTNSISGSDAVDSFSYTFESAGTYTVEADVYDDSSYNDDAAQWTVEVEENNPPSSERNEPAQSITIEEGTSQSFEVDAEDPDGNLDGVEWYVGGSLASTSEVSGSDDTATFSQTFNSQGTYTIEADVFDSEQSYNDEAAEWTVEVTPPTGDLLLTATDASGNRISNAKIILYDKDYNPIERKFTSPSGELLWSSLQIGEYNLELYGPDGNFWGTERVTITADDTRTTIQRTAPRLSTIILTDQTDGDGTYLVGDEITISPEIRNDGSKNPVRVRIQIDTDKDGTAEISKIRGNQNTEISTGSFRSYGYRYIPSTAGTKQIRVVTEAYINGDWIQTDYSNWQSEFNTLSPESIDDSPPDISPNYDVNRRNITVTAKIEDPDQVTEAVVLWDTGLGDIFGSKTNLKKVNNSSYKATIPNQGSFNWGGDIQIQIKATDEDGTSTTDKQIVQIPDPPMEIERVAFNRIPSIMSERALSFGRPKFDTSRVYGSPEAAYVFAQIDNNAETVDNTRVSWTLYRDGQKVGDGSSRYEDISSDTYIFRDFIGLDPLKKVEPGKYTIELSLKYSTSNIGGTKVADSTSATFRVKPSEQTPTVNIPTGDFDNDKQNEQALGNVYRVAKPPESSPTDVIFGLANIFVTARTGESISRNIEYLYNRIAEGKSVGESGQTPLPGSGKVNKLVINTARQRVVDEGNGKIALLWENRATKAEDGNTPVAINYDRAVITATVPDSVSIEDSGDADYVYHDEKEDKYRILWIDTRVDKGIRSRSYTGVFDRNNPSGRYNLELEADNQNTSIKLNYTVSLQLGPLSGRPTELGVYPKQKTINDSTRIYDYQSWQEDPTSSNWMALGYSSIERQVFVPKSNHLDEPNFRNKAVYIWGYADTIATDDAVANRFFERANQNGINTVFLSWEVFKSVPESERAAFLKRAHKNDLQIHALVGTAGSGAVADAEQTISEIITYNEGRSSEAQFDGIHLDIEPGAANIETFLEEYQVMLQGARTEITSDSGASISSQKMKLSSAVGWWWANSAPVETKALVEQDALDYIVVMAYWDTEQEVRNRVSNIVSDTSKPYVVAVETQEFTQNGADESVTFYEEGPDAVTAVLNDINESPPDSEYLGSAIHFYQSSVSTWDALYDGEAEQTTIRPGDQVSFNVDVVFDDNFPRASHESDLTVQLKGNGETFERTVTITPPSSQVSRTTVTWDSPKTIPEGTYNATALLYDTTIENADRIPVGTRTDPVLLDTLDLGEITVVTDTTAPSAETGSDRTVPLDTPVTLDASDSTDNVGITTYEWDLDGDDNYEKSTTSPTTTYSFETTGSKVVTLRVRDQSGNTDIDTVEISVVDTTDTTPPDADTGPDITTLPNTEFEFDGTNSSDSETGISTYEWDVDDDGTYELTGPDPTYTYGTSGTKTVTLRVTDFAGNSDTDTVIVTVNPEPRNPSGGGGGGGGIASVTFNNTTVDSGVDTVEIDSATYEITENGETVSDPYYVVIYEQRNGSSLSEPIGNTTQLSSGFNTNITVDLSVDSSPGDSIDELTSNTTLVAMIHRRDATNETFGNPIRINGSSVNDSATVTVTTEDSPTTPKTSIEPFSETSLIKSSQLNDSSLSGKIRVEESLVDNESTSLDIIRSSATNYSIAITAPDDAENVTFYLQTQAISASQNMDNLTMYLDGEEYPFVVNESAGPGQSPWVAFNVPHFSTRTVSFTTTNESGPEVRSAVQYRQADGSPAIEVAFSEPVQNLSGNYELYADGAQIDTTNTTVQVDGGRAVIELNQVIISDLTLRLEDGIVSTEDVPLDTPQNVSVTRAPVSVHSGDNVGVYRGSTLAVITDTVNSDVTISQNGTLIQELSTRSNSRIALLDTETVSTGDYQVSIAGAETSTFEVARLEFAASVDTSTVNTSATLSGTIESNVAARDIRIGLVNESSGSVVVSQVYTLDGQGEAVFSFDLADTEISAGDYQIRVTDRFTEIQRQVVAVNVTSTDDDSSNGGGGTGPGGGGSDDGEVSTEITDLTLTRTTIDEGGSVGLEAVVYNNGTETTNASYTLEVYRDGTLQEGIGSSGQVNNLEPGENTTLVYLPTFEEPGEYTLIVGNQLTTLTVQDTSTTTTTEEPISTTPAETTGSEAPGFGPTTTGIALICAIILLLTRSSKSDSR